ncbi:CDP-glycerol glycerophosphotransferase family protein [Sporosarcina sp. FA9]|uniref:CDP-glycerol glycerophosphotransferase family protein n=1 Tax=Sporosarcina sp. FA9 TaxID=3413030 RepID=UPI003F65D603
MELKKKSKFESIKLFFKITAAYVISKLIVKKPEKEIVLIGGNLGEKYEDNASVFHRYLTDHYSNQLEVYWMFDPETTYVQEQGISNGVALGSFRNYLLFFRAAYTIHGHSIIYDIAPAIDKYIFLNRNTIMIHISHGIECFKKILIQKEDVPLLKRCDYFNCASQYEKEIKLNEWGIPKHKLIVTGMARFDCLPADRSADVVKKVLVMLTWREWLFDLSDEEFLESDYFRNTIQLVNDGRMMNLASTYKLQLKVILHPFMKKFEHHFNDLETTGGRVEFYTHDEVSIGQKVIESDMLLTDYSSISWDFLYMNKPIIFFTFDQAEFLEKRGSYLNMETELYGYKANTIDEVVGWMEEIIVHEKATNPYYNTASKYIDFFDQKNCERLAQAIIG